MPSKVANASMPLADKVAIEIISEETEILDKIVPRMFDVMQKIANFVGRVRQTWAKVGHLSSGFRKC